MFIRISVGLLTLLSFASLKSSCQSTNSIQWRDINQALAEGLEAKELLASKTIELAACDSAATAISDALRAKEEAEKEWSDKEDIYKIDYKVCTEALTEKTKDAEEATKNAEKQTGKKKFWRNLAIGEGGVLIVIAILVFL